MVNAPGGKIAAMSVRDALRPPDVIGHALHDTNALLMPSFCAFSCFLRAGFGEVTPSSSLGGHRFRLRGERQDCRRVDVRPRGSGESHHLGWVCFMPVRTGGRVKAFPMRRWGCVFCVVLR